MVILHPFAHSGVVFHFFFLFFQLHFFLKFYWSLDIHSALGTWVFSVAGALLAIPVGIKRKSLAPLVFFGTTGTMLDIIMGISACEREHAERQMKLLEAQNSAANISVDEFESHSWYHACMVVALARVVPNDLWTSNCVGWWMPLWHGPWVICSAFSSITVTLHEIWFHKINCLDFIVLQ